MPVASLMFDCKLSWDLRTLNPSVKGFDDVFLIQPPPAVLRLPAIRDSIKFAVDLKFNYFYLFLSTYCKIAPIAAGTS